MSAVSGRSMEEIAEGKGKKRVWHSNRGAEPPSDSGRAQTQREFKAQLLAAAESQEKKSSKSRVKTTTKPAKKSATKATTKQKREPKRPPPAAARRSRRSPRWRRQRANARPHRRAAEEHAIAGFRAAESGDAARHRAKRAAMDPRDQIRRLPHRSAARSRQGQAAHAQTARLDASLRAYCRGGRRASGGDGAARWRIGRRERQGRFEFLDAAERSERGPRRSLRLLGFRSALSGRPRSDRCAVDRAQGCAATPAQGEQNRADPLCRAFRGRRPGDFQARLRHGSGGHRVERAASAL